MPPMEPEGTGTQAFTRGAAYRAAALAAVAQLNGVELNTAVSAALRAPTSSTSKYMEAALREAARDKYDSPYN